MDTTCIIVHQPRSLFCPNSVSKMLCDKFRIMQWHWHIAQTHAVIFAIRPYDMGDVNSKFWTLVLWIYYFFPFCRQNITKVWKEHGHICQLLRPAHQANLSYSYQQPHLQWRFHQFFTTVILTKWLENTNCLVSRSVHVVKSNYGCRMIFFEPIWAVMYQITSNL